MARQTAHIHPLSTAVVIALSLLSLPVAAQPLDGDSETVQLTILAINDFHGALYEVPMADNPDEGLGGLPWLAGAVDHLRTEDPELLLFDGGDSFQGAWPINATRGRGAVEAFNLLGVDASCVGNHDFDYGAGAPGSHPFRGALEDAASIAEFAWLVANVQVLGEGDENTSPWLPEGFQRWTILERHGIRIGVIGVSTQDTPQTTLASHVSNLEFVDVVEAVREVLPEVREAGAEVVVLLGHLTGACASDDDLVLAETCQPSGELNRLLTELPIGSLDVIVAGHEHVVMAHCIDDTFILAGGSEGQALARLDLVVGPDGVDPDASTLHSPWLMRHQRVDPGCGDGDYSLEPRQLDGIVVTPSADALALIQSVEDEVGSLCSTLGCSARHLSRAESVESELGNFSTDALLYAFDSADIALQNGGGLRNDLPEGVIRREHVQAVMPFDNYAVLVEMSGEQLQLLLRLGSTAEHSITQIAGGTYHFDPDIANGDDLDGDGIVSPWEVNRLCAVTVAGEPLAPERRYRVVINNFLYDGGLHAGLALSGATLLEEGDLLRNLYGSYVEQLNACLGDGTATVDPETPRITSGPCQ